MVNWIVWNRTICIKMNLALNNIQRLMYYKTQENTQPTNQPTNCPHKTTRDWLISLHLPEKKRFYTPGWLFPSYYTGEKFSKQRSGSGFVSTRIFRQWITFLLPLHNAWTPQYHFPRGSLLPSFLLPYPHPLPLLCVCWHISIIFVEKGRVMSSLHNQAGPFRKRVFVFLHHIFSFVL